MKILNLYAGIGGNRKLWGTQVGYTDIEVTAVEIDPEIAKIYQDFFPNDKMIIGDAHQYLLEHYKEFDFIWSSPPCPSHSDIKRLAVETRDAKLEYPEMSLYQEIIILNRFFKGKWVIENVKPYYKPLIEPQILDRHCFWSNFKIPKKEFKKEIVIGYVISTSKVYGRELSGYDIKDKRKILRNQVNPELALHIFKCAFKEKQQTI